MVGMVHYISPLALYIPGFRNFQFCPRISLDVCAMLIYILEELVVYFSGDRLTVVYQASLASVVAQGNLLSGAKPAHDHASRALVVIWPPMAKLNTRIRVR